MKRKAGFTLIELVVAIVMACILLASLTPPAHPGPERHLYRPALHPPPRRATRSMSTSPPCSKTPSGSTSATAARIARRTRIPGTRSRSAPTGKTAC